MLCVPSVMILAVISEMHPVMPLSLVGILFLAFEPEIHPTYFMLIVLLVPLGY